MGIALSLRNIPEQIRRDVKLSPFLEMDSGKSAVSHWFFCDINIYISDASLEKRDHDK